MKWWVVGSVAMAVALAASCDEESGTDRICEPGQQGTCGCPYGVGTQICEPDGSRWGPCDCGAGGSGGTDTTSSSSTGGEGGTGTGTGTGGGGGTPCVVRKCGGNTWACGDCIDNDGDELTDWEDPECTGPCDNDEGTFQAGLPATISYCQTDCLFDTNFTSGDDQCTWDARCDPLSESPDYYPKPSLGASCEYTLGSYTPPGASATCDELTAGTGYNQTCLDACLPQTPNGCDCFGCCELPAGTGNHVYLESAGVSGTTACTTADLGNTALCHPCTPVAGCANDCAECELCIGKPTLPSQCGGQQVCPVGAARCGLPGQDPCPAGRHCLTGCCQPLPS